MNEYQKEVLKHLSDINYQLNCVVEWLETKEIEEKKSSEAWRKV